MKIVALFPGSVIQALGLSIAAGTPVMIGPHNVEHMKKRHPADYAKYGSFIGGIISSPDYAAHNEKDDSIEFVKEFPIETDSGTEYVKVAVRVSNKGTFFARSLYALNSQRVKNFIEKGKLKKII